MESSIPSSSTLGDNRSKNPLRFFFTFLSSITRFLGVAIFIIVVVRAVVWAVGPYLADIFESWRPLIIGIQKFLEIEPYSKVPSIGKESRDESPSPEDELKLKVYADITITDPNPTSTSVKPMNTRARLEFPPKSSETKYYHAWDFSTLTWMWTCSCVAEYGPISPVTLIVRCRTCGGMKPEKSCHSFGSESSFESMIFP